ncbi:hypothetical protein RB600_001262 [Gaeumannomyces tritici]
MENTYQYQPLSGSGVRLFALLQGQSDDPLQGEILDIDLSDAYSAENRQPYESLSYVWGTDDSPDPVRIVPAPGRAGGSLVVRQNLATALQYLRHEHATRFLWCDIICINQRDVAERQRQVQLMARVYRMARRVVIWLGPETGTSALGMQTLRQTGRHVRADPRTRTWSPVPGSSDPRFTWAALQEGYSPYTEAQLGAVLELVSRAWFRRLWTRQEVTLARDAVVVAGAEEMSWPTFLAAVFYMDSLVRLLGRGDARLASALFNVYELGCLAMYENVMEVMHACRSCECTLDVDRVYGLLGLLSSGRLFDLQPDYGKDPKMVYHDAVITLFASSARTDFLELCEEASAPSWVPDLHMLGLGTGLNTRAVPYCHASGSSAGRLDQLDANTVEVAGVYCGALGKPASLVLNKDAEARLLKDAIVDIVRSRMGENVDLWDLSRLEGLTKGLLGCLWSERTGRNNHSSLAFSMAELAKWVRQAQHGEEDWISWAEATLEFSSSTSLGSSSTGTHVDGLKMDFLVSDSAAVVKGTCCIPS